MGQDPASISWKQINSENFQIIYPENFEEEAQYFANTLNYVYKFDIQTLYHKPKKISIILHTQSVTSNAMVLWAPKRMEIFTCPPQDSYAENWLQQLAVHEYRHVVQIDKLNQGMTKVLTYVFGEQATGAILGLFMPLWLIEGDAVCTETALSNSGRGRLPSFEMKLRTQALSKINLDYDKAVLGSYKEYVPDRYHLGYFLTAQARKKYGIEIWKNAFDNVAKKSFQITPFSNSIKSSSRLNKIQFYNNTINELDSLWSKQDEQINFSNYKVLKKEKPKLYTNYTNPVFINDSIIISEKSGLDDIIRFVEIDKNGKEETIYTPGFIFTETLSGNENLLVWAEKQYDLRWQNRNYAIIKTLNLKTKKVKKLTSHTRYFAPAISPDSKKIAAVRITTVDKYFLDILNANTGEIINSLSTPENDFFITPSWSDDNKTIVCVLLSDSGKCLASINFQTGKIRHLTDFSFIEISKPINSGNLVYFVGAYSGIDNIYVLNTETKKISQLTSARFGVADPCRSKNKNEIIYSNYSKNGFEIVKTKISNKTLIDLPEVSDLSIKLYESIAKQEEGIIEVSNIPNKQFETKKYSKWKHLFNFHSWAPLFIDVNNTEINPGFSIMSQNKLGTSITTLGYDYNLNERSGKYYANYTYKGFYPVFDLTFDHGKRKGKYYDDMKNSYDSSWLETNLELEISLPLNLTTNKYIRSIIPKIGTTFKNIAHKNSTPDNFIKGTIQTLDYKLSINNILKQSYRDIYPKWGQSIGLNYRNTPFGDNDLGSIKAVETVLFFPGILKHQGIKIYSGIQKKKNEHYRFSDIVDYPRGFSGLSSDELFSISFNYKFPLVCPDLSISSLIYLKRIKLNLFFDYADSKLKDDKSIYRSTGLETTFDCHFLRMIVPFDLGLRTIYKPDNNSFNFEFMFLMDFTSF
ncbi:MAG: PD40 domain-containing protein [Bacteroidales bacterium]|nr:PD40 domain-containing protein [Bacteroidales bacterium]